MVCVLANDPVHSPVWVRHDAVKLQPLESSVTRRETTLAKPATAPHDPVIRDVPRRAHRSGDGLDLHRRIGRAEAEVAAADGATGKGRLLWAHRTARWFRRLRRADHDGEAGGGHLDPQRRETVDRQ